MNKSHRKKVVYLFHKLWSLPVIFSPWFLFTPWQYYIILKTQFNAPKNKIMKLWESPPYSFQSTLFFPYFRVLDSLTEKSEKKQRIFPLLKKKCGNFHRHWADVGKSVFLFLFLQTHIMVLELFQNGSSNSDGLKVQQMLQRVSGNTQHSTFNISIIVLSMIVMLDRMF